MFLYCCTLLYVHSSIAIILMGKRELVALLGLSSWCLVIVERHLIVVPRGCLRFVIVVFPDHTYLLFFNIHNKLLTQKLFKQGYQYHKLGKTFSKFYRRYYDLISKFQVGLKSLMRQGLSEPDFYGDLVYKLKKIVGSNNFSAQFIKIISHYKKIGYNINVLQQTACLVVNPITVCNFAFLFNCTPVGQISDSMTVQTKRLIY